jgi:hypothetical protein
MAERTVNQRQLAVLRWIIDGCPDGVMTDVTYKTTAVALRNRRLVTISKKQGVWKAEATAAGKHFAEHGSYPENHWPNRTPKPGTSTSTAPRTTLGAPPTPLAPTAARRDRITGKRLVDQMLADLAAAGAEGLAIEERDRGRFENLIRSAERYGKIPSGRLLRIERDEARRPVLRFIDQPAWKPERSTNIPVPDRLTRPHPTTKALRDNRQLHHMRADVRSRALRLLDALAKEAERRGHRVSTPALEPGRGSGKEHLKITVTGHSYAVSIDELNDRVPHQVKSRVVV